MFGNYYRNEKITYWFFSLLPIILVLMLAAYMQATSVIDGAGGDFLWCFFAPLAVGTGAILVALQFESQVLFQIQLEKLTPQQKQHIRENVKATLKCGRIYQDEEVLVYYGMFSKQVHLQKDIFGLFPNHETMSRYIPRAGTVVMKYDLIDVRFISGQKRCFWCPVESLKGRPGELPYNTMIAVGLVGMFMALMAWYPRMFDAICGEDVVRKILIYTGYDVVCWSSVVIFMLILTVVAYILRYKYLPVLYDMYNVKQILFYLILTVLLFVGIVFRQKNDESTMARADYQLYVQGEYEQVTGYSRDFYEITHDNNGWGMIGWAYRLGVPFGYLDVDGEPYLENGVLLGSEYTAEDFIESKEVMVYYLPNSKIIIKLEEK